MLQVPQARVRRTCTAHHKATSACCHLESQYAQYQAAMASRCGVSGRKVILALPCPKPRPSALPGPVGVWSGMGRRGAVYPGPPCLHSPASPACLGLALVFVLVWLRVCAVWAVSHAGCLPCRGYEMAGCLSTERQRGTVPLSWLQETPRRWQRTSAADRRPHTQSTPRPAKPEVVAAPMHALASKVWCKVPVAEGY